MKSAKLGCTQLGWLLDLQSRTAEIYRPDRAVDVLQSPDRLSGEEVLPGFVLNLDWVWPLASPND